MFHERGVQESVHLPYSAGLDGLRAVAVIAVLLYHADVRRALGGFLGVEVFFVISGYLITALLLNEYASTGRIRLGNFWLRRARRLLPAAFVLIIAVLTYAVLFLPTEVARLRGDALAALFYLTNWYLIFGQRSYFDSVGRPSLLQHLWSLAVEEQFYLVWPVVLAVMVGGARAARIKEGGSRTAPAWVPWVIMVGALASAGLMALLYQPGVDPSRVYYGTDTRAAGFLVGAALACVWRHGLFLRMTRLEARLLDALGLLALTSLVWLVWQTNPVDARLYRGGMLWVGLLTAAVIAALVHPRARALPWLLGVAPLRWIGLRSYSIYLWHWPVIMLTRPQLDVPLAGLPLLGLRVAGTLLLAELSFRLVEQPVRAGALRRLWQRIRVERGPQRWELLTWAGGITAMLATFTLLLTWNIARAEPPPTPPYLAEAAVNISSADLPSATPRPTLTPTVTSIPTPAPTLEPSAVLPTPTPAPPTATPEPPPPTPLPRILALGDSVMLGTAQTLVDSYGNVEVDAAVSRPVGDGIENLRWRRDNGALGDVVIVHLGNNGPLSAEQFDDMMGVMADVPRVLVVSVKVPRWWQEPNNGILWNRMGNHPNAVLVDWYSASVNNPGYFWDDGIHLRPEGAAAYTQLMLANIGP